MLQDYKIVIGLGNPGKKYENTPHNIGFRVVEKISNSLAIDFNTYKFEGLIAKSTAKKLILVKPLTYMNLSGNCVKAIVNWYKITVESVIIIFDDFSLPIGNIRIRKKGSCGGHKGMESIINKLGTHEIPRLRIGIMAESILDVKAYVLAPFSRNKEKIILETIGRAEEAVLKWMNDGIDSCMNLYNAPLTI